MPTDPPRRHLWAGPRDHGADHDWLEPEPEPEPATVQQPAAPAPKPARRGAGRRLLALAAVLLVVLGGVYAGQHFAGGDDDQPALATLPAVSGTTPATRAGEIYEGTKDGVVQIRSGASSGTGFLIDGDGHIVTNAHVVGDAQDVRVVFGDGTKIVDGRVLGRDVSSDLAAIKVEPADVGKLTPLALADSDDVKTGDEVLAVGYPLGLDRTATGGMISGSGRQIQAENGFSIDKVLQTDASINPGNSGGPLLDAKGRVVGVNSQIAATAAGGNTGIGFAIPSNTVREVVPALIAGRAIKRPYLGVSLTTTDADDGARVAEVLPGGPGDKAQLRGNPTSGDVITEIDGKPVSTPDELISELNGHAPGETVTFSVRRGGGTAKVEVTLGQRPNKASTTSPVTPRERSPQLPGPFGP